MVLPHNRMDMPAPTQKPTLLLTRPAVQSARFAQDFRARFGKTVPIKVSPLQQIQDVAQIDPVLPAKTLILSSENAVPAALRLGIPLDVTAWCVGPRTARAAQEAGFTVVEGPGDAAGLARAMIAADVPGPCLFLRGAHVAGDLAATLTSAGIETHSRIVYRQASLPLTTAAHRVLAGNAPVLLPLFSPRSAQLAVAEIAAPKAPLLIAVLSPAVRAAAMSLPARRLVVAAVPSAPSMLDALATLLSDPP